MLFNGDFFYTCKTTYSLFISLFFLYVRTMSYWQFNRDTDKKKSDVW